MIRTDRSTPAGFTLLEVAVSVAIMGGVIVGVLAARMRAQEAQLAAAEMLTCTRLCASQAASLRMGAAGEGRGKYDTPAGYEWRITRVDPPDGVPRGFNAYTVAVYPPSSTRDSAVAVTLWVYTQESGATK